MTTGSTGDMKPVAKRAIAFTFAYSAVITLLTKNNLTESDLDHIYTFHIKNKSYAIASTYNQEIFNIENFMRLEQYKPYLIENYNSKLSTSEVFMISLRTAWIRKFIQLYVNIHLKLAYELSLTKNTIINLDDLHQLIPEIYNFKNNPSHEKQSEESRKTVTHSLIRIWNNAFHITLELINLTLEELEEIDKNYFYINWLMLQCKDAAVNVSPQTWEGIEDRMLRVI
ncbi:MAG: hypothetical protein QNJ42_11270 [Crocosphaera sp.]|nr:hypothetical protein [Crocosphaera sp.]